MSKQDSSAENYAYWAGVFQYTIEACIAVKPSLKKEAPIQNLISMIESKCALPGIIEFKDRLKAAIK